MTRQIAPLFALLAACGSAPREPVLEETRAIVPGPGLPADVTTQDANHNLDAIAHDGRSYLAFWTAPYLPLIYRSVISFQ